VQSGTKSEGLRTTVSEPQRGGSASAHDCKQPARKPQHSSAESSQISPTQFQWKTTAGHSKPTPVTVIFEIMADWHCSCYTIDALGNSQQETKQLEIPKKNMQTMSSVKNPAIRS
jgi:hypothetical protein